MGFLNGFAGGATLVLGATYLALASHARTRQSQSDHLRAQTAQLNLLARDSLAPRRRDPALDEVLFPLPRAEHTAHRRADVIAAAKDRWNAEVEGAVRWAQTRDWGGWERDAVEMVPEAGERVTNVAAHWGEEVKHLGEEVGEVVGRVVERGRDMVGRARARAQLAEERMEAKVDAKVLRVSEVEKALAERLEMREGETRSVEKALAERFQRREEDTRSVKEVLAERYKPIGERDHSRLWGI